MSVADNLKFSICKDQVVSTNGEIFLRKVDLCILNLHHPSHREEDNFFCHVLCAVRLAISAKCSDRLKKC